MGGCLTKWRSSPLQKGKEKKAFKSLMVAYRLNHPGCGCGWGRGQRKVFPVKSIQLNTGCHGNTSEVKGRGCGHRLSKLRMDIQQVRWFGSVSGDV